MADEIDIANDLIDNEVRRALKMRELRQAQVDNTNISEFCIDCEDIIQPERRAAGYRRCIACAEYAERMEKMFADK